MDERLTEIEIGLALMGIPCEKEQAADLLVHVDLVEAVNNDFNLTTIRPAAAVAMHILDSAAAAPFLNAALEGEFADLGSGAGFPGIPLAILTGRQVTLVESVKKKASFLERVIADIRLKATVQPVRAEELAGKRRGEYSAVTARALSSLPSLVELAAPLLCDGGALLCMKGRADEEEIARGDAAGAKCGMVRTGVSSVTIPGSDAARTIVVYERRGPIRVALPRRNGMAQRQPLA